MRPLLVTLVGDLQMFRSPLAASAALSALLLIAPVELPAADVASSLSPSSRITLKYADAPPATVELDLGFGLFSDLFGISDAVLDGVTEAMTKFQADNGGDSQAVRLTQEQITAVKQVLSIAKSSVNGVQIRIYEDAGESIAPMAAHYEQQVAKVGWDNVLRVKDDDEQVRISLHRESGSVKGALVVATDGDDAVVALVDCDLSPENAKRLSQTITKAALELGLDEVLEKAISEMRREIERELH